LAALDGGDPTVVETYLSLVQSWRVRTPPNGSTAWQMSVSPFCSAVAVLLGAGTDEEETPVGLLDSNHDEFLQAAHGDLPSENNGASVNLDRPLHYLAGLALAWLHDKRRRDAGHPVTTPGFPTAPTDFAAWPGAVVPQFVLANLPDVCRAVTGSAIAPHTDIDLFSTDVNQTRSVVPPPSLPPVPTTLIYDTEIIVRESDRDVSAGIALRHGDDYELTATGTIHAFAAAGQSGPAGWDPNELNDDASWPLHTGLDPAARKFELVGYLGGYFEVGDGIPRTRFLLPSMPQGDPTQAERPLYLRINDDRRGDGSGEFRVRVRVWGEPRATNSTGQAIDSVYWVTVHEDGHRRRRIGGVSGLAVDGTRWVSTVSEVIDAIETHGAQFVVDEIERTPVQVRTSASGRAYLRTVDDVTTSNNLRTLPIYRGPRP
jgi:hypothetical protein